MSLAMSLKNRQFENVIEEVKRRFPTAKIDSQDAQMRSLLNKFYTETVKSGLDDVKHLLQNQLEDVSVDFLVFENVSRESKMNHEVLRYFIQIFLVLSNQKINPLSDPYFIIEGTPSDKSIGFHGTYKKGDTLGNTQCIRYRDIEEVTAEKLKDLFDKHYGNYIIALLKSF